MSNLLTEQGLNRCVSRMLIENQQPNGNISPVDMPSLAKDIIDLIQSQKQAHADMVIGKDNKKGVYSTYSTLTNEMQDFRTEVENNLRADQRNRNKL